MDNLQTDEQKEVTVGSAVSSVHPQDLVGPERSTYYLTKRRRSPRQAAASN